MDDATPSKQPQTSGVQPTLDRRSFLKGTAAAAGAVVAATTSIAQAAETAAKPAAEKAANKLPSETFITNPGSDFMADVIKATGIKYLAINPAAGLRSLQESIINHLGNKNPKSSPACTKKPPPAWRTATPRRAVN